MAVSNIFERNVLPCAFLRSYGAARGKAAADRRVDGARYFAPDGLYWLVSQGDIRHRYCAEQRLSIGMGGILEQLVAVRKLDHLPEIHHHNLIAYVFYYRKIMGYKHIGKAHIPLKIHKPG